MRSKNPFSGGVNIGDCRNITWDQMWERFRDAYTAHYPERELAKIHLKWKQLSAEIWGPRP